MASAILVKLALLAVDAHDEVNRQWLETLHRR